MINMLKADLYRIFRSKSFWITQIILVVIVVLSVYFSAVTEFEVSVGVEEGAQVANDFSKVAWTGCFSIQALMQMSSILAFVMMPIFKIIVGNDLSKEAYKNIIPIGISRTAYLSSKYVVFLVVSLLQFVFYYLSGFLVGTVINGVGQFVVPINEVVWSFFLSYCEFQALYALMMLVLYLSFSNVAAILFGILYPMLISIPVIVFPEATWLNNFNFGELITYIPVSSFSTQDWIQLIVPVIAAIVIGIAGSVIIFKKKEL